MKYTDQNDIYANIEVGMDIFYYNAAPTNPLKGIRKGRVTKIKDCVLCGDYDEHICRIRIGVDNQATTCFMYNGRTSIISISDPDFIEESEMQL